MLVGLSSCDKGKNSSLPLLFTNDVVDITDSSATCGGTIADDGNKVITVRGVCWSTSSNPTVSNLHTTDGSGLGQYNSYIAKLAPSTSYSVRAYATNENGTAYGEEKVFTTAEAAPPSVAPTVTTASVQGITSSSAMCGGNVVSDGGSVVTACGVCWSTVQNPDIQNNSFTDNGSGTGSYTSSITGLSPQTTYYVRAYAANDVGVSYGDQLSFKTTASGSQTVTLSDFLGTYNVTAYNWDSKQWETWQGTRIEIESTNLFGPNSVVVYGMMSGEGYDFFRALGKYDNTHKCIRLFSGWGGGGFIFSNDPDVTYRAYFYPILANNNESTCYYISTGGCDGSAECGEAWLTINNNGSVSLGGSDTPDDYGRYANVFFTGIIIYQQVLTSIVSPFIIKSL